MLLLLYVVLIKRIIITQSTWLKSCITDIFARVKINVLHITVFSYFATATNPATYVEDLSDMVASVYGDPHVFIIDPYGNDNFCYDIDLEIDSNVTILAYQLNGKPLLSGDVVGLRRTTSCSIIN